MRGRCDLHLLLFIFRLDFAAALLYNEVAIKIILH